MTGTKTTVEHSGPERPSRARRQAALIAAFPRCHAMPLPALDRPVGRAWLADADLADAKVSGQHVRFSRIGSKLHVEDVGSRNGSWLDGERLGPEGLDGPQPLNEGAVLRLGGTLLVYRQAFDGDFKPASPIGELIGPYGLRNVAQAVAAFERNPPGNVLIEGETGTGKELAARAVAVALGRAEPYVAVNVAGVPTGVFESQLFGHTAGAFSDARSAAPGTIAAHDKGAVFLDELSELPLELQPKLLRLLENHEVQTVGAERPTAVDVLLIAATNRDLQSFANDGHFRLDLYARLALARMTLPPLRDRPEDVFAIARHLADGLEPAACEVEAIERMMLDPWPSNVRGVQAMFGELASIDPAPGLRTWSVEQVLGSHDKPRASAPARAVTLTAEAIQAAIDGCGGNETQAARRLGVSRGKLRRFLKKS